MCRGENKSHNTPNMEPPRLAKTSRRRLCTSMLGHVSLDLLRVEHVEMALLGTQALKLLRAKSTTEVSLCKDTQARCWRQRKLSSIDIIMAIPKNRVTSRSSCMCHPVVYGRAHTIPTNDTDLHNLLRMKISSRRFSANASVVHFPFLACNTA